MEILAKLSLTSILFRSNYGSEKEITMFGGQRVVIDLEKKFPSTLFSPHEWNLREVTAVHVDHRKMACGYVLVDAKSGRKIVFSGDTRPCDLLVKQGKGMMNTGWRMDSAHFLPTSTLRCRSSNSRSYV